MLYYVYHWIIYDGLWWSIINTNKCNSGCINKYCHIYTYWTDDTYNHEDHQGYIDGNCVCNHYFNNITSISCNNYIKYRKYNTEFIIMSILGGIFCFFVFVIIILKKEYRFNKSTQKFEEFEDIIFVA